MPDKQIFWNPYRHVPASGPSGRGRPSLHHDLKGHRGVLTCRLEAKTALMVADQTGGTSPIRFWRRAQDGRPTIPGTSLKGALRSLAEMLGRGCPVTDSRGCCSSLTQLCPTCRLFGMSTGPAAYRGHVSIGDAALRPDPDLHESKWPISDVYLSGPKPRHRAFYPGNAQRQRKVYHHQPQVKERPNVEMPRNQGWRIQPAPVGAVFDFQIRFLGLDDDLLDLLIYALVLEGGCQVDLPADAEGGGSRVLDGDLCNKLGYAKPLGLGSYQVTLTQARVGRYGRGSGAAQTKTGAALDAWINERTASHVADTSPRMMALRRMLVFDSSDTRNFRYPDQAWFRDNPTVHLRSP